MIFTCYAACCEYVLWISPASIPYFALHIILQDSREDNSTDQNNIASIR